MKKYISPLILLSASFIWGLAFVAQKAASELPPFTVGAVRSIFAMLFLFPMIAVFDKATKSGRKIISLLNTPKLDFKKRELVGGALSGIFLFAATSLQQTGLGGTDAGKASFITALYVVIVPFFALALKKIPPASVWLSGVIAVFGFYLLCISDGISLSYSDLLVLICAFIFALQIMCIDIFLPGSDPIRFSFIQFSVCALLSSAAALIFEYPVNLDLIYKFLPQLLFLGILSSGVAYTLQIIGQKSTPAPVATIILSLESVFGALASAIILGERLSVREYIGCGAVFCAVLIAECDPIGFILKGARARKKK